MKSRLVAFLVAATALGGCTTGSMSLSGIGGSNDLSCAAPPGVSCMSVTGIGVNAAKGNLPALKAKSTDDPGNPPPEDKKDDPPRMVAYNAAAPAGGGRVSPKDMDAPYSGAPLRTPPRVLRIWMAPFEDTDSDLHDQKFLYVTVHTGRWLLEANQVSLLPKFKHVFPLEKKEVGAGDAPAGTQVDANGEPVANPNKVGAAANR